MLEERMCAASHPGLKSTGQESKGRTVSESARNAQTGSNPSREIVQSL